MRVRVRVRVCGVGVGVYIYVYIYIVCRLAQVLHVQMDDANAKSANLGTYGRMSLNRHSYTCRQQARAGAARSDGRR